MLKRLVPDEEKNEALFDVIKSALAFLKTSALKVEELKAWEYITLLKILNELGYLGDRQSCGYL